MSWGKGIKNLLTPCYSGPMLNGKFGPIDPTNNATYEFLEGLLKELVEIFPDQYMHFGGDEVDYTCW